MDNRAIAVMDSGLGGLTAYRALRRLMPEENIIYFADEGNLPYGRKSRQRLREIVGQSLRFLSGMDVKYILVACGTATTNAADIIIGNNPPAMGVVEPAIGEMSRSGGSAPLGAIATEASIKSGVYLEGLKKLCPEREIIQLACPDFVPLIEGGHVDKDDPLLTAAVARTLSPMKAAGIGALLLGCTHYGIIAGAISAYLGSDVSLISAADCAAEELCREITGRGLAGGEGKERFFTSGDPDSFAKAAQGILGRKIEAIHVDIQEAAIQ